MSKFTLGAVALLAMLSVAAWTNPSQAGVIRCDIYDGSVDYQWTLAHTFYTDSIDYLAPWHPYGMDKWRADFYAPLYVATTGTYGFTYEKVGGYIGALVDAAGGSVPGVADWDSPYLDYWGGWNITAGYHTFQFETSSQGNPSSWWPDHGGAYLVWDNGVTFAPEPATLALMAMGGGLLFLVRRRKP